MIMWLLEDYDKPDGTFDWEAYEADNRAFDHFFRRGFWVLSILAVVFAVGILWAERALGL